MARPLAFTQPLADFICERIAGGKSLLSITRDDGMPSMPTVLMWARTSQGFLRQYLLARDLQADAIFDECLEIADDPALVTYEDIQRARLRIATRQWMAGKLRPKKYGSLLTQSDVVDAVDKVQDIPQVARKIAFILAQAANAAEPARIGNGAVAEVKHDGNDAAH